MIKHVLKWKSREENKLHFNDTFSRTGLLLCKVQILVIYYLFSSHVHPQTALYSVNKIQSFCERTRGENGWVTNKNPSLYGAVALITVPVAALAVPSDISESRIFTLHSSDLDLG